MSLKPGRVIADRLRLVEKLAQGGMGSIWIAEDLTLKRRVALKFLSPSMTKNREAMQRFLVEAQAVARLSSPHVPQVFDHGETPDGLPYIAMELLRGQDLHTRLDERGPLSMEHASTLVTHVAAALTEAHELGIVHRDIKPENIFLVRDEDAPVAPATGEPRGTGGFVAKLLDFGIAKPSPDMGFDSLTLAGQTMGTPQYMSPEQLLNARDVDMRSDLWSLGIVAYHALTRRLPFDGDTFAAVCVAIDHGAFDLPSVHRPGITPALDAWFRRALSRDPLGRFASAAEMSRAFTSAIEGRPSAWSLVEADAPAAPQAPRPSFEGSANTTRGRGRAARGSHRTGIGFAALGVLAGLLVGLAAFAHPWGAAAGASPGAGPGDPGAPDRPAAVAVAATPILIAIPAKARARAVPASRPAPRPPAWAPARDVGGATDHDEDTARVFRALQGRTPPGDAGPLEETAELPRTLGF